MRETRVIPFDIKAVAEDTAGAFEGYGSVFGTLDSYRDIVAPGAFTRTLKEDRKPAMLWQHDQRMPVGVWTDIREDDRGLYVKGQLADTQQGRDTHTLLKMGALSGLSIGFSLAKNGATTDGKTNIRTITDVKLWEVSLVTFPANDPARIALVKADGTLPTERELERWLQREAGFTALQAEIIISKGYRQVKRGGAVPSEEACGDLLESIKRFGAIATGE